MPNLLGKLHDLGVPIERVKEAMASIGCERHALHELEKWESKRTTGPCPRENWCRFLGRLCPRQHHAREPTHRAVGISSRLATVACTSPRSRRVPLT
jgi:hypothetical protein